MIGGQFGKSKKRIGVEELGRLPPERFETLRETYYEKVWEGIVSRFGVQGPV